MGRVTRRDFIKAAAVATGAMVVGDGVFGADAPTVVPDRYVTCFYQWDRETLKALSADGALLNGPEYLHIFSASHAGHAAQPKLAKAVQDLGPSFKYARAIDIWKYKGWQEATDEQLRAWAIEFRKEAMPDGGTASDLFAFNEMPTGAEGDAGLQRRIAKWMRYLHDPGDGGPKLPAVFYLVEENVVPSAWKGDAVDELWAAVDETSEIVVGEHYHNKKWLAERTPEQITEHLFALAKWLDESGKGPQRNIARHKYAVLHSTYYGPQKTNWEGLTQDESTPAEFKEYLRKLVEYTRASPYGKRRISFGPLKTKDLATAEILPALAAVLREDVAKAGRS
jgi:hypothetical protein